MRFLYTKASRAQRMIYKRSVPASVAAPCTKQSRKGEFIPGQEPQNTQELPQPKAGRGWGGTDFKDRSKGLFQKITPSPAPLPSRAVFPGKTEVTVFLFNTALYCIQHLGASIAPSAQLERKHTGIRVLSGPGAAGRTQGSATTLCLTSFRKISVAGQR